MTAKRRTKKTKKILKRKQSNAHPHTLPDSPVVAEGPRIISEARLHSVSLVAGEGFPGSRVSVRVEEVKRSPEEQFLFDEFGIDLTEED